MNVVLALVGSGLIRNLSGWLENALEDGKVSRYEWGQLGSTVFRVGVLFLGLYFGLDVSEEQAAGLALVGDMFFKKLAK